MKHIKETKHKKKDFIVDSSSERLCQMPGLIPVNDDINKVVFNRITLAVCHPSKKKKKTKTFILRNVPEMTRSEFKQRRTVERSRWYLLIIPRL